MSAPTPDENFNRAMKALRAEYLAAAPQRIGELWSALERVQNGESEGLPELRILVHRLAGSGGGYGFAEVSAAARAADTFCRSLIDAAADPGARDVAALRVLIQGVADAFARAPAPE